MHSQHGMGCHDDAPNNLFSFDSGPTGHRLALSVHQQPYRPHNGERGSANESRHLNAELHFAHDAGKHGHHLQYGQHDLQHESDSIRSWRDRSVSNPAYHVLPAGDLLGEPLSGGGQFWLFTFFFFFSHPSSS